MRPLPRSTERELLDGSDLDPLELERNLREMAMLNRLPGGVGASVSATLQLLDAGHGHGERRVLDVGSGSGDFARALRRRSAARIVLADSSPAVRVIAARTVARTDDVEIFDADARHLPLDDGSVDVAHASLLLHHLDPPDAVAALREMRRVARAGVVVNDLRRGRLAFLMIAAPVLALTRSRYTRHDGILSARRAYTLPELDALAADAGLRPVARTPAWWPRVTTTYR
jgi:SAM-dependent methyltransferase